MIKQQLTISILDRKSNSPKVESKQPKHPTLAAVISRLLVARLNLLGFLAIHLNSVYKLWMRPGTSAALEIMRSI